MYFFLQIPFLENQATGKSITPRRSTVWTDGGTGSSGSWHGVGKRKNRLIPILPGPMAPGEK
jgi:hypothetical protein